MRGFMASGIGVKGGERILGDGDFVMDVLKVFREEMEQGYRLKAVGFTLEKLARRLKLIQPAVCISVRRGERIAKQKGPNILGE